MVTRTVFYISDGTGISAETLGHSLITQFDQIPFRSHTLPYIDSQEKARAVVAQINAIYVKEELRPIIFSTIVKPEISSIIAASPALVIDFFQSFIGSLEQELNVTSQSVVGLSHRVLDEERYNTRIEAVNYALECDDGIGLKAYSSADVILLGVSRTGKTPTCLYLALQYGIRAANYPLTEEDLQLPVLPKALQAFRKRLFGLTIAPDRLQQIRSKRRPNSAYASLSQCEAEINAASRLYRQENIASLNSTYLSVEELSAHILTALGLRK